jgi:hypothetical protein
VGRSRARNRRRGLQHLDVQRPRRLGGYAFVATVPIDVSFVLFLMSVMTAVLALVVWVELSLREAAIYVAVDFLPLTFVAMVWQPTAIWCQRLAEGLLSVILS